LNPGLTGLPPQDNLYATEVDLNDIDATALFVENTWNTFDGVDAAVLLAGGFAMGGIGDTTSTALEQQYRLNFLTAYNLVQPLFDKMIKKGKGDFVLIASRPAFKAADAKNMVAYSLSKGQLVQLSEILNAAGKSHHVKSTIIAPSKINTPGNRKAMPDADPTHWVHPKEIAETIAFVLEGAGKNLRETILKMYNEA
jgi:NAD(P)-dependent dehydrogenase (short-subunit alcohol dehydrogenase family)